MTYDEAKIKAFEELIPPVGTAFSCPSAGMSRWVVWEVHEYYAGGMFMAALKVPSNLEKVSVWNLNDYWHQLNTGSARRRGTTFWAT